MNNFKFLIKRVFQVFNLLVLFIGIHAMMDTSDFNSGSSLGAGL